MTDPHRADRHDDDPTGMRDLLSTLPDPGPMPDDLVARINASLAEEAQRREGDGLDRAGAEIHPLLTGRARRRRPWLLGAAAAYAAIALGGVVLGQNLRGQGASTDAVGTLAPRITAQVPSESPGGDSARTAATIGFSGTRYTSVDLRGQASRLLADPPAPLRSLADELGPLATSRGVQECLTKLGVTDPAPVVDLALYDGRPAAVIVSRGDGGHEVRVVRRSCSASDAALIKGPYRV